MNVTDLPRFIIGFEDGFNENADVIIQSADGADLNRMWSEFQQTVGIRNKERDGLIDLLTYNVQAPTERILYPTLEDFEEASEYGEPKGVRLGTPFTLGFPFKWYDLAIRYTWMFLAESTSGQIESLNNTALEADRRLVLLKVLRSIFSNVNETATILGQAVNVYRAYNNDGTVPPPWKTYTHDGTHQHYLASGAGTIDGGDLSDLELHLYHHGYGVANGYQNVLMVNRQEADVIRTLVTVSASNKYAFLPGNNFGGGVVLPTGQIIARPGGAELPGQIGTWGPFKVVEDDLLPPYYCIAFATGGERSINNPIGIREHANPALRGLQLVKGRNGDYPLQDSFYRRGFGAGIRHRGAIVVMKVTAGAYDIPTGYA